MFTKMLQKVMPKISDTERAALECGTVSLDGDIFKGNKPTVSLASVEQLTAEERSFLENETTELIELQAKHGYTADKDLHPDVWKYMRDKKFLGMMIPKQYGGLGFSPLAQSLIVSKLSTSTYISLAVSVMVPNSLGPAELLLHYGTDAERDKYLPRLASGEMIPCFALTGPRNGSDATSQMDMAYEVEPGVYEADLDKRYITLAPIADLIGLALHIEGKGITLFLVEKDHPGLDLGKRHNPLNQNFMNGPIFGKIRLTNEHILGGPDNIGKGWHMLVDCLSVGRAVSLPALGTAASSVAALATGAYASTRNQFGIPIAKMEGVQEALAEIAYQNYITYVGQMAINGELLKGEQPAALGAMWKYQSTERGRKAVSASMDVLGGAGIQMGPSNFMGEYYTSMPIAITVEGANILSRSLVTFGQGLMRGHPNVRPLVEAIQDGNDLEFMKHIGGLLAHTVSNNFKALFGNKYAMFAFTANMALTLGAKYKRAEYMSGRLADIFAIRFFDAAIDAMPDSTLKTIAQKRLYIEERKAYKELLTELPLLPRIKVKALMLRNFFSDKLVTANDNKEASQEITKYTAWIKQMASYVHLGGRIKELESCYHNKDNHDVVIEVDSK